MENVIILDLCGTLIEASHVTNREKMSEDYDRYMNREYNSRIAYIGRKVNRILTKGNRGVIVTAVDHTTLNSLVTILSNIDENIDKINYARISYYIEDLGNSHSSLRTKKGKPIEVVNSKDEVYQKYLTKYPFCHFIAIDDRPYGNNGLSLILKSGGEFSIIKNSFNSKPHSLLDTNNILALHHIDKHLLDERIEYYNDFKDYYFSGKEVNIQEIYWQIKNGKFDIEAFYQIYSKKSVNQYLIDRGFTLEEINDLYVKNVISIEPSFEKAYQKRLLPKIR